VVTLDPGAGVRGLTAVTDARGRFDFPAVAPGAYTVRRRAPPGWLPADEGPQRISVRGPAVELELRYRFDRELARAAAPYPTLADLVAVPGRDSAGPLGAPDEFGRKRAR
jgi:hypothetical protein